MSQALPILFVPHGAPTFALNPGAAGAALAQVAAALPRPRAIVMVSPHWETDVPTVGSAPRPETIHDFWGFPAPLYDIQYPAIGAAEVADRVFRRLDAQGLRPRLDPARGLDHGAWIPLRLLFPTADVPVVPLSIQAGLGPEHHFQVGEALADLPGEGILLVASGNITHNLRDFQMALMQGTGTPGYVQPFADWMWEHVAAGDIASLLSYRQLAPAAVRAHPTDDHLLPLFVALGAAGTGYRAERLSSGIDSLVLAMDGYALSPSTPFELVEEVEGGEQRQVLEDGAERVEPEFRQTPADDGRVAQHQGDLRQPCPAPAHQQDAEAEGQVQQRSAIQEVGGPRAGNPHPGQ